MTYPPVPYVSQQRNGVLNDCGPAAALMLSRWLGKGMTDTVAQWADRIDAQHDGTTPQDLAGMLKALGLTPLIGMAAPQPRIELVQYNKLPVKNPTYKDGTFAHWIVRLDDTHYHDPLRDGSEGANLTATKAAIDAASLGFSNSVSIVERPAQTTMAEPARTPYERVYHVINSDATEDEAVAIFRKAWRNNRQTVGASYDDAGVGDGLKSKTAIIYGIPTTQQARFTTFYRQWYPSVSVQFANTPAPTIPTPPPTPQPQPPSVSFARHLGVSALIDAQAGFDALSRGCRAVLFLNNNMAAVQAAQKYPDAITFMRTWWGAKLTPQQMADAMDGGSTSIPRNCYSTVLNESDTWGYGTPDELRERFRVEKETCEVVWRADPNRIMCIGQFSHGTPDITRADIRQAWRDTYGAFAIANKGRVRIGWHLYTKGKRFLSHPPQDAPIIGPEWFEGRDNEFWKQTNMPADALCICDETGVEGGAGGFRWAGYNAQQFTEWAWWWLDYQAAKYVKHDAMVIFQYGDHPGWQGYDCRYLVETLTGLWQNKIARPPTPRTMREMGFGDATPPADYSPPMKDMDWRL